jgi:hypothetical protein
MDIFVRGPHDDRGGGGDISHRKKPDNNIIMQVKFEEGMVIPSEKPTEEVKLQAYERIRRYRVAEIREMVGVLEGLLEECPMWSKKMLIDHMMK